MKKKAALPVEPVVKTLKKRATKAKTSAPELVVAVPAVSIATPVKTSPAKASKPVRHGRQFDTVLQLYEKFLEATKAIRNTAWSDSQDKKAKAILDRGLDSVPNRLAMKAIMLDARSYGRFEKAMGDVHVAWADAQLAWIDRVKAENAKSHKGQLAIARAFFTRFAGVETRITTLWEDGPKAMEQVLDDLENLTYEVANFCQPGWCNECGTPVWEITPKNGKPPFVPKLCQTCFKVLADESVIEPKHKVKKPGSAAKRDLNRGHIGRTKGGSKSKGRSRQSVEGK